MLNLPLTLAADKPNPLGHVVDKTLDGHSLPAGLTGTFSMHMVTLMVAAVLTMWLMMIVAKAFEKSAQAEGSDRYIPKGRFAQTIEAMSVTLRDQMIKPQLGDKTDKFLPYLLTLFFFILVNNLLGLVPLLDLQHIIGGIGWGDTHFAVVGGTATGNLAVTAGLATIAFFIIQINGIRENGFGGWFRHLLGEVPVFLMPLMFVVEVMSMFIKPVALAIRLCANMVAGHTLVATFLLFSGMGLSGLGLLFGSPVVVVSILAGVEFTDR